MSTFRTFSYGRPMEDVILFFDDFLNFEVDQWTATKTGLGTAAIANENGGVLLLTNAAADDDNGFYQYSGDDSANTQETFKFVAGKKMQIKGRFKLSDATDSDFVFGLATIDTSPLAVVDGILFQKDDGDAFLDFKVVKDSAATQKTAIATLTNNAWFTVEAYYDGSNEFALFVDGVAVGKCLLTTVPDDEELAMTFGVQNGAAAAAALSVDYIKFMAERS